MTGDQTVLLSAYTVFTRLFSPACWANTAPKCLRHPKGPFLRVCHVHSPQICDSTLISINVWRREWIKDGEKMGEGEERFQV